MTPERVDRSQGRRDAPGARLPKPTPEQAAWQDLELGMFFHFDINVFTDEFEENWRGLGRLDPNLYSPGELNTDQWMEAARAMGARYTVFVAKHCTGFLSWQSDLYAYGVKQARWRDGKGDVVRDYVASSRKYGISPGLYCSMGANAHLGVFNWDGTNTAAIFGRADSARASFVRMMEQMVTELWGNYGPLPYVWFDGGTVPPSLGGPDLVPILKRLQPGAVTFQGPRDSLAGNTRWPGNESGMTAYPCWATVAQPNQVGAGDPDGAIWQPGECDAPLRRGWFWHPNTEREIKSLEELVDMYYRSVGRGCNLILNANVDRRGLVPEADMRRFREFGDEIRRRFGRSLAEAAGEGDVVEIALPRPEVINHAIVMEQVTEGQRIREYVVQGRVNGAWRDLSSGSSVGHKRIDSFEQETVSAVRLKVIRSAARPLIRKFAVYRVTPRDFLRAGTGGGEAG